MRWVCRMRPRIGWLALVLIAGVALAAGCGQSSAGTSVDLPVASVRGIDNTGRGLDVGQLAPDFEMQYPDGKTLKLSDYQGKPVIINFWATWCAPCEAELPEFVQAYEQHKDQGLVILGVNAQETAEDANTFVEKYGLSYPIALDSRGEVMDLYSVRGLPTTLFIDPEGRVAVRWAGILTKPLIEEYLAEILPK